MIVSPYIGAKLQAEVTTGVVTGKGGVTWVVSPWGGCDVVSRNVAVGRAPGDVERGLSVTLTSLRQAAMKKSSVQAIRIWLNGFIGKGVKC